MTLANFKAIIGPEFYFFFIAKFNHRQRRFNHIQARDDVSEAVGIAEATRSELIAILGSRAETTRIETMMHLPEFPKGWRQYN